jgi:hypothetical protein
MNSYKHFPTDEFDANDPFGREPSSKPYQPQTINKRFKRAPGDLIALMDQAIDRMGPMTAFRGQR